MRIILVVGILMWTLPGAAQSPPEGFRDLKWGATPEAAAAAFPAAVCRHEPSAIGDWTCVLKGERVNEVTVMVILAGHTTGKAIGFNGFSLSFRSDDVRAIVEAFEARYGKSSAVEQKEFVTKIGERVPTTEWTWEFPAVRATIMQHSGRLGTAIAIVGQRARTDEMMQRAQQRKPGAGKGL